MGSIKKELFKVEEGLMSSNETVSRPSADVLENMGRRFKVSKADKQTKL